MRIGGRLFLLAIGAILKFGVDLTTVGVILMIVGVLGLALTLVLMTTRRRTDVIHRSDGTTLLAPNDAVDPIDGRY